MRKPTAEITWPIKANGSFGRKVESYSYVVVLCQQDGPEVKAARMDYYRTGRDAVIAAERDNPGWNIKFVHKLYDDDFIKGGGI